MALHCLCFEELYYPFLVGVRCCLRYVRRSDSRNNDRGSSSTMNTLLICFYKCGEADADDDDFDDDADDNDNRVLDLTRNPSSHQMEMS
mmetsp:Transcript_6957/g.6782  ORF Transcript_6957/g.6782 Transcript_6957/m.6782 type:complete len:89 (-) Transcript_6957:169-435(-)